MPAVSAQSRSVCLVSLGCAKNLVDSEVMVGHLDRAGIVLVTDPADSDVVIVNTCGFIDAAREESVDTVLRYTAMKERGELRGVVVTGCLVQLHEKQLAQEIPEVDAFLGLSDYSGVPSIVDAVLGHSGAMPGPDDLQARTGLHGGDEKGGDSDLGRALLTPAHTAYLRLGEGCNHICAFCAIPKIRGKLASKPLEVIVEEATALAELGTRELTLVAEDSTDYGKDLGQGYGLSELLVELGKIEKIRWVRVMYAHPATIDAQLIQTMADVPNVVPYLDMPVQHGDADVLRAMRRGTSPERIRDVVGQLRAAIPDITLRTTILVGFPGETDERFGHLLSLLEELRFDRVGCFVFSAEETTEAAGLPGPVSRATAEDRQAQVMALQRQLLTQANRARIGTEEDILVDSIEDLAGVAGKLAIGRSVRDALQVDGQVLVSLPDGSTDNCRIGSFARVRITGQKGYDLVALPSS
jgi:ribosomal protein S12 methylthiotransferase